MYYCVLFLLDSKGVHKLQIYVCKGGRTLCNKLCSWFAALRRGFCLCRRARSRKLNTFFSSADTAVAKSRSVGRWSLGQWSLGQHDHWRTGETVYVIKTIRSKNTRDQMFMLFSQGTSVSRAFRANVNQLLGEKSANEWRVQ